MPFTQIENEVQMRQQTLFSKKMDADFASTKKERWMPIASNLLAKTANRRPSSFWAYLTKQITSGYMQVPEDLQVFIVNLQVKLTSSFKLNVQVS